MFHWNSSLKCQRVSNNAKNIREHKKMSKNVKEHERMLKNVKEHGRMSKNSKEHQITAKKVKKCNQECPKISTSKKPLKTSKSIKER